MGLGGRMGTIKSQRGFIHILVMAAMVIIILSGAAIMALDQFGFIQSGPVAHEQGLTNRAEIRAADQQSARESFQQNLILLIESGRQMFFIGFFFMGAVGIAFFAFGFMREINRHHERVLAMQFNQAAMIACQNQNQSPALPAANQSGHNEDEYLYSGVAYALVNPDHNQGGIS